MEGSRGGADIDQEQIIAWVKQHDFQRIALQVPDDFLVGAATFLVQLQQCLLGRRVFLLGDSTYGSSSVDEVGAQHYGADCIVHVGSSDQEHVGTLPVLFVFGGAAPQSSPLKTVVEALQNHFGQQDKDIAASPTLVLLCEVAQKRAAEQLPAELSAAVQRLETVLVAEPQQEALASTRSRRGLRWHDWRFGRIQMSSWWAALGPLALAAEARPEPLRVCGREVRRAAGGPPPPRLPTGSCFLYVGEADSALERRLLLRYANAHPVWRLDLSSGDLAKLSSNALLLQRYRRVENVKVAGTVGLLLCATGASYGALLADRLEALLKRAGRRVYRFVVGRVTPEKLGQFPAIECFVSLASPDHFPFDTREFHVPIASPYEVEVALGVREWTGCYVTDLEELLAAPLPQRRPGDETLMQQALGAGARLHAFHDGSVRESAGPEFAGTVGRDEKIAPALAIPGLHGVAGRYATEGG